MTFLGEGTYGSVSEVNGLAIKKFKKTSHLIREYAALIAMQDCPYIVNCKGVNMRSKEVSMELYDSNLKRILFPSNKLSSKEKYNIIVSVMRGLMYMHDHNISHADLKLDNILFKHDKIVLGDCGLSSNYKHCNIEDTAPAYKDNEVIHDGKHDLYSLGICIYEIIVNKKITHRTTSNTMLGYVKQNLDDSNTFKKILLNIFGSRESRKSVRELLIMLHEPVDKKVEMKPLSIPKRFETMEFKYHGVKGTLCEIFKDAMYKYNLERLRRSYYILTNILEDNKRWDNITPWIDNMLYLNRCLFGSSKSNFICDIDENILKEIINSKYFKYIYI